MARDVPIKVKFCFKNWALKFGLLWSSGLNLIDTPKVSGSNSHTIHHIWALNLKPPPPLVRYEINEWPLKARQILPTKWSKSQINYYREIINKQKILPKIVGFSGAQLLCFPPENSIKAKVLNLSNIPYCNCIFSISFVNATYL